MHAHTQRGVFVALLVILLSSCSSGGTVYDTDGDGSADQLDCDPVDPEIYPNAPDPVGDGIDADCDGVDGTDADGDGFLSNVDPDDPDFDCDDRRSDVRPDAVEIVNDGLDNDCDGLAEVDEDLDGYLLDDDCDDNDPQLHPDAAELLDGIDNDCDGTVDNGTPAVDDDDDGYCEGWSLPTGWGCSDGAEPGDCDDNDPTVNARDADGDGATSCTGDCDDTRPDVHAQHPELCDGVDNDCSGTLDLSERDLDLDGVRPCAGDCDDTDAAKTPLDSDGDGASSCDGDCDDSDALRSAADGDGDGTSSCDGDCDDRDPDVHPGAAEVCNGRDDNCDGIAPGETDLDLDGAPACADCDDGDPLVDALDRDGDGVSRCEGDCDDLVPSISPAATDLFGDGIDVDCDGIDGVDADGDGFAGLLSGGADCDDTDPTLSPRDQDADGASSCAGDCDDADPALNTADHDGDGSTTCGGDCDDTDATVEGLDRDGDGHSSCAGDCDDLNPLALPGAVETCNTFDDNCDGLQTSDELDLDGDGDATCADCDDDDALVESLDRDGDGVSTCDGDCDDTVRAVSPLASDLFGDGIDTDCDGADGVDLDGDGSAGILSGGPDCDDSDPTRSATDADGDGSTSCDDDCDDNDASRSMADLDGDGFVSCDDDCDDNNASLRPGDLDGDGLSPCDGDCDDSSALALPGGVEVCDLVDNDCDGVQAADEVDSDGDGDAACSDCDDNDATRDNLDRDGDGAGTCDGDCDDLQLPFHPTAADRADDGFDQNCDGVDGVDADGDGYAGQLTGGEDCDDNDPTLNWDDLDADGYATCDGDCDDSDPARHPDLTDTVGDGIDWNCDGHDGEDADGDGYASQASGGTDCDDNDPVAAPRDADGDGYSGCSGDCNDDDSAVFPGALELCDGVDSNCAPDTDEEDGDGDGDRACASDCDDDDPLLNGLDLDGDGVSTCGDDCDDDDPTRHPGIVWEVANDGLDTDCGGTDLMDLATESHFSFIGASGDGAGTSVIAADLDGDGLDELIVGAPLASPDGVWDAGAVYIVPGTTVAAGGSMVADDAPRVLTLYEGQGSAGDSLLALPDLDGDGHPELAVGAPVRSNGPSGTVFLVRSSELPALGFYDLDNSWMQIHDVDGWYGSSALAWGNLDNDGLPDLAIGHYSTSSNTPPGQVDVVVGTQLTGGVLSATGAWTRWAGAENSSAAGRTVAFLDFDGDGLDELFVGDRSASAPEGAVYYLPTATLLTSVGANALSAAPASFVSDTGMWSLGAGIVGVPDIDGDGDDELAISASTTGTTQEGAVYVFPGGVAPSGVVHTSAAAGSVRTDPTSAIHETLFGAGLLSPGDLDGDGVAELVVGATGATGLSYTGHAWLIPGTELKEGILHTDLDIGFNGPTAGGRMGAPLATGDFNGDGRADLVFAAPESNLGGNTSGSVHVVLTP